MSVRNTEIGVCQSSVCHSQVKTLRCKGRGNLRLLLTHNSSLQATAAGFGNSCFFTFHTLFLFFLTKFCEPHLFDLHVTRRGVTYAKLI